MKKATKKKIVGAALASLIVFSGVTPVPACADVVTRPNKIASNAAVAQAIAEEGAVLLKNDYGALPLKKSDAVAGFSTEYNTQVYGGGGSGWVNATDMSSYHSGLGRAAQNNLIKSYNGYSFINKTDPFNKVIYFISRATTEGEDLKPNQFYLDNRVKADITDLIDSYGKERVIIVLNIGTVCDTTWLIEQDVAAIVLGYYGGEQAGNALANVLTGEVTPSGKTVDTWAKSYDYYPSSDASGIGTFAGDRSTYYTEDVYVGYRYFSTFDPDYEKVNYEFGYGLSYTKFRMDKYSCSYKDGKFTVSAEVTNIGAYAGKEVMQVYFEAPKGVMGAPAAELAGFAKTELLRPGQSQTVKVTFDEEDLARYDDTGKISLNSWVIEKGDYKIRVGNSVKNAYQNAAVYTHTVKDDTVTKTTCALRDTMLEKRLLSDGSYETLAAAEAVQTEYTVPAAGSVVVQAENYSERVGNGTSEIYYAGTMSGFGMGNLNQNGTSLSYKLKVEKAGKYRMAFNFSSAWNGQNDMFRVYVNGAPQNNVIVSMDATHTDSDSLWHTHKYLSSNSWTIDLPQGDVELKLAGNGLKMMNFDSFIIYNADVSAEKATLIQAETYKSSNVNVVAIPDGAATAIANAAGKYYEYALNVAAAGKYYLSLKASNVTAASDDIATVSVNGAATDTKIALMRTAVNGNVLDSNYYTFTDTAPVAVDLPQGEVTLRITTKNSALCCMDSLTLIPESAYTAVESEFVDNTDDFRYITDLSGKTTGSLITYDDVYADPNKMDDFIGQLSITELTYLTGLDFGMPADAQCKSGTGGVGGMRINGKYGIPYANTSDGPAGIRYLEEFNLYSTWFPCMTMLASTWNPELATEFGKGVAMEAVLGNVHVWLAPGVNIHRNPLCGRNFEYFSEDPFIAGTFASAITKATQSYGVSVCIKHFAANNQETNRFGNNAVVSARALREIYLKAFEMTVTDAHPFAIMSSYNMINGLHAASSPDLITDMLYDEWGFEGAVFSDWIAHMSHISLIKSGNTFKSANPQYDELVKAYQSGVLTREDLERNAKNAIKLLMLTNVGGQTMTVVDAKTVNTISDNSITKTVATSDGKLRSFIRFSITEGGEYVMDTSGAKGTVKAHCDGLTLNGTEIHLDAGIYEIEIEYTGNTVGTITLEKKASAEPPVETPPDDKPIYITPTRPAPKAKDGLSGGAIAGIVVGSVALVGAAAAAAVVVTKKRKKAPATEKPEEKKTGDE